MTMAEIHRMIRAAVRAARKEGAPVVEVTIGGEATVRIPLAPEAKPIAESRPNSFDRIFGGEPS